VGRPVFGFNLPWRFSSRWWDWGNRANDFQGLWAAEENLLSVFPGVHGPPFPLRLHHGTGHDKEGYEHPGRVPRSRLLTFEEGSDSVRVQCYRHTNDYARQGWYPRADRRVALARPFNWPAWPAGK
jgi:hypothetical protein